MTLSTFLLAFGVLALGAAIQGAVGFGANLFAAPLLVLLDPAFVPGPIILSAVALNLLVLGANRGEHPWWRVRWANAGQVLGCITGAAVLGSIPTDHLASFFAVMVLLAVGLAASGMRPRRTPVNMASAGAASGFMGTTVGIGGPPIALIHADDRGTELRAALSRFFLLGTLISLSSLAVVGRFGGEEALAGLALVPGVVTGYFVSRPLARIVDRGPIRAAVLVLSGIAALAALTRALL